MKKIFLIVLASSVLITAASCQTFSVPKVDYERPSSSVSASSNISVESASPSPSLTGEQSLPGSSYIPDIVPGAAVPAAQMESVYEDSDYIYFLRQREHSVYRIRKTDNNKERIIQNCVDFTLVNGTIYYSKTLTDKSYAVCSYDTVTQKTVQIFKRKYPICNIVLYEGRFYYCLMETDNFDYPSNLYSCGLEGGGRKLIAKNVSQFCISDSKIYYSGDINMLDPDYTGEPDEDTSGEEDDTYYSIYECSLDGSGIKEIDFMLPDYFSMAGGKLFYISNNFIIYDTKTKTNIDPGGGYCDFAFGGQYLFYCSNTLDDDPILHAYDINTGVLYDMFDINDKFGEYGFGVEVLLSGADAAYFLVSDKDSDALYRIVIKDGKASYEKITDFEGATHCTP